MKKLELTDREMSLVFDALATVERMILDQPFSGLKLMWKTNGMLEELETIQGKIQKEMAEEGHVKIPA